MCLTYLVSVSNLVRGRRSWYPFMQNDKLKLLKSGSLQHLGENMLAFLQRAGASSYFSKGMSVDGAVKSGIDSAIYFDILVFYTEVLDLNVFLLFATVCWFKNFFSPLNKLLWVIPYGDVDIISFSGSIYDRSLGRC